MIWALGNKFWRKGSISNHIFVIIYQYNSNAIFFSDACELDGKEFIEIDSKEDDCLGDIEKCKSGLTLGFRLKIITLVDNTVIFSSGGENDESYGKT